MGVYDSGITNWRFDPSSGLLAGRWRFMAKLATPVWVGPYECTAVGLFVGPSFTQHVLFTLGVAGYAEGEFPSGVELNVHFPGPFDVVPDRPVVPWG